MTRPAPTAAILRNTTTTGEARSQWTMHLVALLVVVCVLMSINWTLVESAVTVWVVSPTYSHCFFIIPVSGFFVWEQRRVLTQLEPAASPAALWFAAPFLALQLVGIVFSTTEIQQVGLVGLAVVFTLALLGPDVFRQIRFPMLFLFFLVPMGEYLIDPMQRFTTWFISEGLTLLGILHHTEGTIIQLVGGDFRVAEACAGLRFLIATIAIGTLFCYLNFRRWYKIALYMLASAIVPIIANGFRALGIVLLAHYSNNRIATGADHLVYGWGFSVLILAMLMIIGARFSDPWTEMVQRPSAITTGRNANRLVASFALSLGIVAAIPAFAYWNDNRPAYFDKAQLSEIRPDSSWKKTSALGPWKPEFVGTDAVTRFGLESKSVPSSNVDVNIFFYAKTRSGHGIASSSNALWNQDVWHVVSQGAEHVTLGGNGAVAEKVVLSSGQKAELVIWTYWVNGHFTTSAARTKLGNLQSILGHGSGSALVAFSTSVDSDVDVANVRIESAIKFLDVSNRLRLAAGLSEQR